MLPGFGNLGPAVPVEAASREAMPPVPEGKVRIAEYGSYDPALDADRTVLAQAVGALHGYPVVELAHETRGFVPAGSQARWQEARWSVLYTVYDGGIHGRNFAEDDEAGARAYFAKLTDPQAVSAKRQEDAWLEETVYAPARAKRAAEEAARREEERQRRNALARRRRAQRGVA